MTRALLLDLDGTLADSLHVLRQAYGECARRHGREPLDAEFDAINGPPLPQVARLLARRWALERGAADLLLQTYETLVDDAYRDVDPAVGASDLLILAASRGWTLGVVTSNGRVRARGWLERVALAGLFQIVVTHEDVRAGKPAPDGYALALRRAGGASADSLAVEDSSQGVAAARAAHLTTLAIDPGGAVRWPAGVHAVRRLADVAAFL